MKKIKSFCSPELSTDGKSTRTQSIFKMGQVSQPTPIVGQTNQRYCVTHIQHGQPIQPELTPSNLQIFGSSPINFWCQGYI